VPHSYHSSRNLRNLPGLKQEELTKCILCDKGVMHSGNPIFFRITIEQFVVDVQAARRVHGMEQLTGNPEIARILGPSEDIAKVLNRKGPVLVCSDCSIFNSDPNVLLHLFSKSQEQTDGSDSTAPAAPAA
jgi:hypothetical protein